MKKIYLIALSIFAISQANAQLSLTKAANEPTIGDTYETKTLDSTNTMPLGISGTGVDWNFDGLTEAGSVSTFTIGAIADYPNSPNYPGTTMVQEDQANGTLTYFKSTATGLEILGVDAGFFDINFNTNSAIVAEWPITYGYTNDDLAAGAISVNTGSTTLNGTFTATINTTADGTGIVNINNLAYARANCLRVKRTQDLEFSILFGAIAGTIKQINYDFYHSSSKYPILTVNYNIVNATSPQGPIDQTQSTISVLNDVTVGINEKNINDVIFRAYPNPTKNNVNIHFVLTQTENYTIEVVNTLGQVVKTTTLLNLQPGVYSENIDLSGLTAGVYYVKVSGKKAQGIEKLIVE